MVYKNRLRIIIFFSIFLSIISLNYAAFPQFEYNQDYLPSGSISIFGNASSGTQINLYINDDFVGYQDIIAQGVVYSLKSTITDIDVPLGSTLTFRNDNPSRTYRINIPGRALKTLSFGDVLIFSSYEEETVSFTDEIEGVTKNINVVDTLSSFEFENVNSYLIDGENKISFTLKHPLSTLSNQDVFDFFIDYVKYTNDIIIDNYPNVTNDREVTIEGYNSNSNSNLYYVMNYEGVISNLGALTPINLDGNNFELTLDNLQDGKNTIRFVTIDPSSPSVFNGETFIYITSDRIPPKLDIVPFFKSSEEDLRWSHDEDGFFTNSNNIYFNITTDAVNITRVLNGKNDTFEVVNGSLELEIPLNGEGEKNDLTLIAVDLAGNIYKEAHEMYFDNRKPTLDRSDPDNGDTVHFFYQNLNGKTNKPFVQVTAFTIPEDSIDKNGVPITCNNYNNQNFFYRNLGQLNLGGGEGAEVNLNESQLSLLSLISKKETVKSDKNGTFDVTLVLHQANFDSNTLYDNYENTDNTQVEAVASQNTVCFAMLDKFGNYNIDSIQITLDNGNTNWKASEVTTIPNSVYAAEIEQVGDVQSGTGNVEFGMTVRMQYVGGGRVTNVNGVHVRIVDMDREEYNNSNYGSVDTSRLTYYMNPDTNEMIVYVPVQISPLGMSALDYPSEIKFSFAADLTYDVENIDIPIDTTNPIYFQSVINIERPLDHTKWLTPETIEGIQGFLNKTLNLTIRLEQVMQKVSVYGMLTCTGASLYHTYEVYQLELKGLPHDSPEYIEAREKIDTKLYTICDRIYSTESPPVCKTVGADADGNNWLSEEEYNSAAVQFSDESGEKVIGVFTPQVSGDCELPDGSSGKYVSGDAKTFSEESTFGVGIHTVESQEYVTKTCLPMDGDGRINFGKINAATCYSPGYPKYDNTRCNFFGLDNNNQNPGVDKPGGVPGRNPAGSIISSVRCGAIVDTYTHLRQYRQIQEGIYQCLEEAKLGGAIDASYCERLLAQSVCDIATNVVLPEVYRSVSGTRAGADGVENDRSQFSFLDAMQSNQAGMNSRYGATAYGKAGLSTDSIINKACLWAITGDWSVLEEGLMAGIEVNEVEPVFGPPFAESRIQGYDPITGDLSIRYFFTYGAVSGGQSINTMVELICDTNAVNGDYCPDEGFVLSSSVPGTGFKSQTLYVAAGQSVADSVVISDNQARFWYNKIRLTHTYTIEGEQKVETYDFPIGQKREFIPADCSFSGGVMGAGAGFSCRGVLFGQGALSTSYRFDTENTKIIPTSQTNSFYPGNSVFAQIGYYSAGQITEDASIAYLTVCNEGTANQFYPAANVPVQYQSLNVKEASNGRYAIELMKVPANVLSSTPSTIAQNGSTIPNTGNAMVAGSCKVYLRMMPTSEVSALTKDNFETYNAVGSEYTNANSELNQVLTKTFSVRPSNNGTSLTNYFELVKPFDSLTVCVEPGSESIQIPLSYVLQNSKNDPASSAELRYSITSNKYVLDNSGNEAKTLNANSLGNTMISVPMSETMKAELNGASSGDSFAERAGSHLFGTIQPVNLNLRYNVEGINIGGENTGSVGSGVDLETPTAASLGSGDISLILVSSNDCEEINYGGSAETNNIVENTGSTIND